MIRAVFDRIIMTEEWIQREKCHTDAIVRPLAYRMKMCKICVRILDVAATWQYSASCLAVSVRGIMYNEAMWIRAAANVNSMVFTLRAHRKHL